MVAIVRSCGVRKDDARQKARVKMQQNAFVSRQPADRHRWNSFSRRRNAPRRPAAQRAKYLQPLRPIVQAAFRVDVPGARQDDNAAAPVLGETAGALQPAVGVVVAGDDHALERQGLAGDGGEAAQAVGRIGAFDIGGRHQQRTGHFDA